MEREHSGREQVDGGRRATLKPAGAALAAGAASRLPGIGAAHAQGSGGGPIELTFAFGPDDSGSLAALVEAFNAANEGRIRITHREMARASDAYYRQLRSDFEVGDTGIDVVGADLIWTAEFATEGWVRDLEGTGVLTTLVAPGPTLTSSWENEDPPPHILPAGEVAELVFRVVAEGLSGRHVIKASES